MQGENVGTGYVPIKPDTEGFGPALEQGLDAQGVPAAGRSAEKMQQAMKGVFLAGAAVIAKSVIDFAGFEKGMNEVFSLLPGITGPAMDEMEQQAKDFAVEFGVLPTEVVPALYEALGAGVPQDNVFEFLETAQKLALGGVTDLATAVDGLSSITNAYGTDVIGATEASDVLFKIVGLGKGTVDDIASSLFQVTPIAAAMGVSFQDVGGAIAVLTAAGTPASVAMTQVRGVIGELGKDGTKASKVFAEATGKTFPEFIAEGNNLADALAVMDKAATDNGASLIDMFGSIEAGQAALGLMKEDGAGFIDAIAQMEGAAGSTEAAYDQMNQGLSRTMDNIKAKIAVQMIDIGDSIAPTVGAIGEGLGLMLDLFSQIPGPLQTTILLLGTLTAGVFGFSRQIVSFISVAKSLNGVFLTLAANPWTLVLIALVGIAFLIIKNWDTVKESLAATWDWMREAGGAVGRFFEDLWNDTAAAVALAFDAISAEFTETFDEAEAQVNELASAVTGVFSSIVGAITGAWSSVVGATSSAWSAVYGTVTSIGGQVVGWITGIPTRITGAFTTLAGAISAPFIAAFGAIKAGWNSTVGGFGFKTPSWIPGMGGKSFTIPSMAKGGVLDGPQLFLGGEYPGASSNPEVVAPQSVIRNTMVEALDASGGGTGLVIETHLHVDGLTDEGKFARMLETASTTIVRIAQRELDRSMRGGGMVPAR